MKTDFFRKLLVAVLFLGMSMGFVSSTEAYQTRFLSTGAEVRIISQSPTVDVEYPYVDLESYDTLNGKYWITPWKNQSIAKGGKLVLNNNILQSDSGMSVYISFSQEDPDTIRMQIFPSNLPFKVGEDLKGLAFHTLSSERLYSAEPVYFRGKNIQMMIKKDENSALEPVEISDEELIRYYVPKNPFFPFQMNFTHHNIALNNMVPLQPLGINTENKGFTQLSAEDHYIVKPEAAVNAEVKIRFKDGNAYKTKILALGSSEGIQIVGGSLNEETVDYRVNFDNSGEVSWQPLPLGQVHFTQVRLVSDNGDTIDDTFINSNIDQISFSIPNGSVNLVRVNGNSQFTQNLQSNKSHEFTQEGDELNITYKHIVKAGLVPNEQGGLDLQSPEALPPPQGGPAQPSFDGGEADEAQREVVAGNLSSDAPKSGCQLNQGLASSPSAYGWLWMFLLSLPLLKKKKSL